MAFFGTFGKARNRQEEVTEKMDLDHGLEASRKGLFSRISRAVVGRTTVDDTVLDDLEEALVTSDVGVETTLKIIERLQERVKRDKYLGTGELNALLRAEITGLMKAQIDNLPLNMGGMRPTQGRTLAVMQVSGGSQSFNAVNTLRLLGRWMRMITIPNQSSVAKAYQEFDEAGRMKPSSYYDRIVDVMEELVRFTILTRPHAAHLVDRYSERKATGKAVDPAADLSSMAIARPRAAKGNLPTWTS